MHPYFLEQALSSTTSPGDHHGLLGQPMLALSKLHEDVVLVAWLCTRFQFQLRAISRGGSGMWGLAAGLSGSEGGQKALFLLPVSCGSLLNVMEN